MNFKQSPGDVQRDSCSEKFHEIKKQHAEVYIWGGERGNSPKLLDSFIDIAWSLRKGHTQNVMNTIFTSEKLWQFSMNTNWPEWVFSSKTLFSFFTILVVL